MLILIILWWGCVNLHTVIIIITCDPMPNMSLTHILQVKVIFQEDRSLLLKVEAIFLFWYVQRMSVFYYYNAITVTITVYQQKKPTNVSFHIIYSKTLYLRYLHEYVTTQPLDFIWHTWVPPYNSTTGAALKSLGLNSPFYSASFSNFHIN